MKNLATSKNDICLIAGSGLFVYEVANYLNNKNLLNQIILINENNLIKKKFKDKCKSFKIKDLEKITTFIRSKNLKKIIIIGYVKIPSIDKINLSIKSQERVGDRGNAFMTLQSVDQPFVLHQVVRVQRQVYIILMERFEH